MGQLVEQVEQLSKLMLDEGQDVPKFTKRKVNAILKKVGVKPRYVSGTWMGTEVEVDIEDKNKVMSALVKGIPGTSWGGPVAGHGKSIVLRVNPKDDLPGKASRRHY
jgi:hypothetical protein